MWPDKLIFKTPIKILHWSLASKKHNIYLDVHLYLRSRSIRGQKYHCNDVLNNIIVAPQCHSFKGTCVYAFKGIQLEGLCSFDHIETRAM